MSDGSELDYLADLIPEGAVPIASLRIVTYLDDAGETCLDVDYDEDIDLHVLLGLAAYAQHHLASRLSA
jgi:hypothetical protein